MRKFSRVIFLLCSKIKRGVNKIFIAPIIKGAFLKCGKKVTIGLGCKFAGIENIVVGNDVVLGDNMNIMSTKAKIILGSNIMFGPEVLLVSGNHRIDLLDKYMSEVTDAEKLPENDQDIIIEDDCWIGARAIILKGVRIGRGSVVGAGAVVTKSFEPYSIIGGIPAKKITERFTSREIEIYEKNLEETSLNNKKRNK